MKMPYKLRFKYHFKQSINYPYWWRNFKFWGYRSNKKNPIYKIYWYLKK